jgi:hypothetical protein
MIEIKIASHYQIMKEEPKKGMTLLRSIFAEAEADEMNFCLFSTSGVHGDYTLIEEAEAFLKGENEYAKYLGEDFDGEVMPDEILITYLVVHPRLVCLKYGLCIPQDQEDIEFLKKLRKSSWKITQQIGEP